MTDGRATIAVSLDLQPAFIERLAREFQIAAKFNSADQSITWSGGEAPATVLIVPSLIKVSAAAIRSLPSLRLICCFGTGFDGVDLAAARAQGIIVTHSPGGNAASVAEMAIGLLLATTRHIVRHDHYVRSGQWRSVSPVREFPFPRGLSGSKLGIFGLGAVGLEVARRATAFGMDVGYHNPRPRTDVDYSYFPALLAMAHWADCLILSARPDDSNRNIVDAKVLEALGPHGYLVNVARGSLIDELALIEALETKMLAGAGLDVFAHEPAVSERLMTLPQVVLSPHAAGRSQHSFNTMGQMVLDNIGAFLADRIPPNVIPPLAGYQATLARPHV